MNAKQKVLDEMIKMLGDEDGKMLMKHPRIMAAKISVAKPVEKKADPEIEMEDDESEMELPEIGEELDLDSMDDDMKAMLLKKLSKC